MQTFVVRFLILFVQGSFESPGVHFVSVLQFNLWLASLIPKKTIQSCVLLKEGGYSGFQPYMYGLLGIHLQFKSFRLI